MDLKEKSSQVAAAQKDVLKSGAAQAGNRLADWVKEPGNAKDSSIRVLWLMAGCVMWFVCVRYSPLFTLLVTPLVLLVVFVRLGAQGPAPEPVEKAPRKTKKAPPEEVPTEAPEPADEFWVKHTPSEAATVTLEKTPAVTPRDEADCPTPAVPLRPAQEKAPVSLEKPQVSPPWDSETAGGTPDVDEEVTDHDVNVDHVGIFPADEGDPTGQEDEVSPQVSEVSQQWDTPAEQATEDVTESEIGTDQDEEASEDFAGLLLKLSDQGMSIREIAEVTGKKRSTVGRMLKKAKDLREASEIASAAVRAKTRQEELADMVLTSPKVDPEPEGTPVLQVVLPGAWYGEDAHAQEVKFSSDAVVLGQGRTQEEAVSVMDFIRSAFLGKAETTTENWAVSLDDGTISGAVPNRSVDFRGFWSETGTVVVRWVSLL